MRRNVRSLILAAALLMCGLSVRLPHLWAQTASGPAAQSDWTQWRGPNRDGTVTAFSAPATWPEQLTKRWSRDVGLGYASPLIVGNRLFMFSRQGEDEVMSALDASTGAVLWTTAYRATFTMNNATSRHGAGPKSTPVFADGKLFAIGMAGAVSAFDASTGKLLWQKPGGTVFPTFTSYAFSPLVERGVVIFHVGGNNQGALTAFDVNTGDVKWSWNGDGPSYGSPIVTTLDDTRQIITLTQTKLVGVDAVSGSLLWERPFTSPSVTNAATPLLYGHTVIASNGGPVIATTLAKRNDQWVAENAWQNADAPYRLSNALLAGDMVFGFSTRNSGQYFGLDATTGATLWTSEGRQAENAALLHAGDLLFSLEADGELIVLHRSRTAFEPVHRYKLSEADTWTAPAISGNRVFVKDVSTLALWTLN